MDNFISVPPNDDLNHSPLNHNNSLSMDNTEETPHQILLIKANSKEEKINNLLSELPLKKYASLPSEEKDHSNSSELFKIRWIINNLLEMKFNINICYHIIENMAISDRDPIIILNEILDKYDKYVRDMKLNEDKNTNFNFRSIYEATRSVAQKLSHKANVEIRKEEIKQEEDIFVIEMKSVENQENLDLCEICYENKPNDFFYELQTCNHKFCKDCLAKYLLQKINSSNVLKILCPSECGKEISEEEMKKIFSADINTFNKYIKYKKLLILNTDPNLRWCIRPGCNSFVKGKGNEKKVTCEKCRQEMCFKCRLAWHDNISCVKALDNEFKAYSKNTLVKPCPNCSSRIEKNDGCNHIHCTRCNYDFCWLCRGKYNQYHYKWFNILGCPNMQFRYQFGRKETCLRYLRFFATILYILMVIPLSIIFFLSMLIIIPISTPGYLYFVYCNPKKKVNKILGILVFGLIGLILFPIILILEVCPGSCILYKEYKKRKANN